MHICHSGISALVAVRDASDVDALVKHSLFYPYGENHINSS